MDKEKGELHSQLGGELVDITNVLEAFGVPKKTVAMVLISHAGLRDVEVLSDVEVLETPKDD